MCDILANHLTSQVIFLIPTQFFRRVGTKNKCKGHDTFNFELTKITLQNQKTSNKNANLEKHQNKQKRLTLHNKIKQKHKKK